MNATLKTRQMTIRGNTTHEGFVILEDGTKMFSGIERKTKKEALQDAQDLLNEACPNCGSTAQYKDGKCGCGYIAPTLPVPVDYDSWEDYEADQEAALETIRLGDY